MMDSKKVGLVAVSNHNYGSQLQTFAMHFALSRLGVDNEVIKYKQSKAKQLKRMMNPSFVTIKGKAVARDLVCKVRYPEISKGFSQRSSEFERFKKEHVKYSPLIISREVLEEHTQGYAGIVLGSDQVWHPANLEMDYFTLSFVPDSIPKITYAPSFGVSEIPSDQIKVTRQYLSRIDSISVRESRGAEIIKELIGREVPVVCDPTALLTREEWDEIRGKRIYTQERYIFCYFLGSNRVHREFAEKIKKATGYKIIALQHMDEFVKDDLTFGDVVPFDVGPDDFINLIARAEIVLTDSFHGTMFSIYYHKNFFTFSRFSGTQKTGTNSRIASILNQLGLNNRWLTADENPNETLERIIDWKDVDIRLEAFRASSIAYLENAVKKYKLIEDVNKSNSVADKKKEDCTGCTACVHSCPVSAIQMKRDFEGFDYPAVDSNICIECGLCLRTCPVNSKIPKSNTEYAFAARNINNSIRMRSSSGGLFTSLAEQAISESGVVAGAAFSDKMELEHVLIDRIDDIGPLCASKYVQSSLNGVFKAIRDILDTGRKVLFCGTPCQVAGLHAFLKKDYANLLLVDVLCYGVPSPGVFEDFISFLEQKHGSKLKQFHFRDKTYGYASPNVKAVFADNSFEEMTYDVKSYTNLFFKGVIARPSCAVCSFKGTDRVSDLTLGDYWDVGKRAYEMDDDTGATLVLAHTEKGQSAVLGLKGVAVKEVVFNDAVSDCGPMLMSAASVSARRNGFYKVYRTIPYIEASRCFMPETTKNKIVNVIKPFILKTGLTKTGILKIVKRDKIKKEKLT